MFFILNAHFIFFSSPSLSNLLKIACRVGEDDVIRWLAFSDKWNAYVVVTQVHASGVFELRLKSFVNEYGKDSLGKCCSGNASKTGECSGVCKTWFRVCLKQYQAEIDTTSPCTYGDVVTPVLGENVFNLSANVAQSRFTNPINFPFDFTWPVSLSVVTLHI